MRLRPEDILAKTFSKNLVRGFDPSEVLDFLQMLSEDMSELIRQKEELQKSLSQKEALLQSYANREELLKNTVTAAQQMSEKLRQDAEQEAKLIINEAKNKADLIQKDARDSLKVVYQDIADLRRLHIQFKNTVKSVLQTHEDLLDEDPVHTLMSQMSSGLPEKESLSHKNFLDSLSEAAKKSQFLKSDLDI